MENGNDRIPSVVRFLLLPLIIIFLLLSTLSWILFSSFAGVGADYISKPNIGSLVLASTALLSLYIAWTKLIYKRRPFVKATWDIDEENEAVYLKMINLGEKPVGLMGFNWSFGKRWDQGEMNFRNDEIEHFEEDYLPPHEEIKHKLGEGIIVAKVNDLPVQRVDGKVVEVETPIKKRRLTLLRQIPDQYRENDVSAGIQEFFRGLQEIEHGAGTILEYEELREDVDELLKEHESDTEDRGNIWRELKHKYEEWRYGILVAGQWCDDRISNVLFKLAERKRKNKQD